MCDQGECLYSRRELKSCKTGMCDQGECLYSRWELKSCTPHIIGTERKQ